MLKPHHWTLLVILAFIFSCKSKQIIKPMEYYNPFEEENEASMFFIDIEIDLKKMEEGLNQNIPDTLFNSNVSEAGVDVQAFKSGNIKVNIDQNAIDFKIPLKLNIKKNLGIGSVSADGEIEMDFRSTYTISPDWDISTTTDLLHHNWMKRPVLKAGFIKIPVESIANIVIGQMRHQMVQTIDNEIDNNFDLKSLITKIWAEVKKPILVSPEYNTWAMLRPAEFSLMPLKKFGSDTLKTQLQVLMSPTVNVSKTGGQLEYEKELPPFQWSESSNESLDMNINSFVPFEEAEAIAKANLMGQSFGSGKNIVKVEDIDLYGQGNYLIVETLLTGTYNGAVFVKGEPKYDPVRDSVILDDLKVDLKTKNIFMKGAGLIFKKKIKKMIQESLEEQINFNITEMKKMIQQQLDAPPLPNGIDLKAQLGNLKILNVYLTPKGIKTMVNFRGNALLQINGIPSK